MNDITFELYKKFSKDNFCLIYDGNIVDEVTDKIIDLSEFNYENQDNFKKSRKKVSFLLAECFQNIIRHGENLNKKQKDEVDFGFFLTRHINNTYFITSANLVKKESIADLKAQLNKVNSLDKESLKAHYLDKLENKDFSEKGGAGLGLIEIARKSGQKIEYLFDEHDHDFSVFYNQVMIKDERQIAEHTGYRIIEAIELHRKIIAENIIIIQKGDFSKDFIHPVLNILEKNLRGTEHQSNPRKKTYHVLVEMVQNISKYTEIQNDKKEGLFLIQRKNNKLVISAGNFIKRVHKEPIKKQLLTINTLNKKDLKELYLKVLNDENKEIKIELLEIAKHSDEPLYFSFTEANEGQWFFTLRVIV